jgi:sulfite reductase (ferredoxin)
MYRIPTTLASDIDYTESLIKKYKAGEITAGELKSNRVPMGIYEQRKNHHHMLRIRCTGGLITPKQLKEVAFIGHQVSTSHSAYHDASGDPDPQCRHPRRYTGPA